MEITLDYILKSSLEKKIIKIEKEYEELDKNSHRGTYNNGGIYEFCLCIIDGITKKIIKKRIDEFGENYISYCEIINGLLNIENEYDYKEKNGYKKVKNIIRNICLNKIKLDAGLEVIISQAEKVENYLLINKE